MRIDEITEALPGEVGVVKRFLGKVGLGGREAAAEKAFIARAKQAYRLWLTQVPKLQQGGLAINDQKIYADYFGRWMAPNLKLVVTDPIIKNAIDELKVAPEVDQKYMIGLISKMMGQQRSDTIRTSSEPPPPPPPPPLPPPPGRVIKTGSQRKASDGQIYRIVKLRDGSREWHDLTGNIAVDKIQKELGQKYGV